jgi:hypothetical protein
MQDTITLITKIKYEFSAKIWQHSAPGGWYFVSLPVELSNEIRENVKWQEEGWGRMRATATIRGTTWETAIWFDTKLGTYLLPIKAVIRGKERITIDSEVMVEIRL